MMTTMNNRIKNSITYAMTAYRNYELARLLKILKTIEIKED